MKKGYADIGEEVIKNRTGKSFWEWRKILDEFNVKKAGLPAGRQGHTTSAKFLREVHRVSP